METVKHYNYLAIWLLDPKDPYNSPTYFEYPCMILPKRDRILQIIKNYIRPEYEDFTRVKVTLKTHRDKRKILDRDEFYV